MRHFKEIKSFFLELTKLYLWDLSGAKAPMCHPMAERPFCTRLDGYQDAIPYKAMVAHSSGVIKWLISTSDGDPAFGKDVD